MALTSGPQSNHTFAQFPPNFHPIRAHKYATAMPILFKGHLCIPIELESNNLSFECTHSLEPHCVIRSVPHRGSLRLTAYTEKGKRISCVASRPASLGDATTPKASITSPSSCGRSAPSSRADATPVFSRASFGGPLSLGSGTPSLPHPPLTSNARFRSPAHEQADLLTLTFLILTCTVVTLLAIAFIYTTFLRGAIRWLISPTNTSPFAKIKKSDTFIQSAHKELPTSSSFLLPPIPAPNEIETGSRSSGSIECRCQCAPRYRDHPSSSTPSPSSHASLHS
ncbi:hypothetical protein SISSUDRAFT_1052165 [Sistotremastrum suecicum HHB10207 ss-3]|uniref:Uncharacterized protein n=1 Tax=Sistotremastrum suecicum HHB10207 ss-3 TaxID=1314776 RepID=A0A166A387_9AGAM|nr:hypothetical protein SISSUDRAFT_1052165 [Sistotremastrum suecicum HHB10207 ss-3]